MNGGCWIVGFGKLEWLRVGVSVEVGRVLIRFEERNMEYWVKSGEVRREVGGMRIFLGLG